MTNTTIQDIFYEEAMANIRHRLDSIDNNISNERIQRLVKTANNKNPELLLAGRKGSQEIQ